MNTDQILRKILSDTELKKHWTEITNADSENVNTIRNKNNIYLKYLNAVLADEIANDNVRRQIVANLIS
ncbi:hypothetical protein [Flavobacterium ardleyense]|uniref:hypothetical protein n=1 Tax=Flavobacterium ardleyense TaxID=2038737 RepID=UPI00298CBE9C|nr:hypothetical protein [Flavobacterium ardleyense]